MLQCKLGVVLTGLRPELLVGLMTANDCYAERGYACVITSVLDGDHAKNSLHYAGAAADLRTRDISSQAERRALRGEIAAALGADFDVVLESTHLHIEWQPRGPA